MGDEQLDYFMQQGFRSFSAKTSESFADSRNSNSIAPSLDSAQWLAWDKVSQYRCFTLNFQQAPIEKIGVLLVTLSHV
jgi:hypothetical protein